MDRSEASGVLVVNLRVAPSDGLCCAPGLHRFWNSVIEPVMRALPPDVIVEIGAADGRGTARILDYCRREGAVAHVIDPLPQFSVPDWQKEYGERFIFHRALSLDALPRIAAMDVVLIDGDHNWYTVFHELRVIEDIAEGAAARFPVVFMHDLDSPWGRRDAYYNPDTIPESYRLPHEYVGSERLSYTLLENTPRNGVRTALEDFVEQSAHDFRVVDIPGWNGLGILAANSVLAEERTLEELLTGFESKEFLFEHCRRIDKSRFRALMKERTKRKVTKKRVRELERELPVGRVLNPRDVDPLEHEGGHNREPSASALAPTGVAVAQRAERADDAREIPVPRLPARSPGSDDAAARLYLDLLKRCLTRIVFEDYSIDRKRRGAPVDPSTRSTGRDTPATAETMIGIARLDNLEHCTTDVLRRGVPGDLIETGVWRGGATIFMRGVLQAYGVRDRKVWAADSFEGLPRSDAEKYPADIGDRWWAHEELAVPLERVKENFARYGLLDDQVEFLVGWFSDTLPAAPIEQLAVLRLDGDMYESTIVALESLYPKVSPGGYVIVDDYGAVLACRKAVHDFRARNSISDEMHAIDWTGVYWQRVD